MADTDPRETGLLIKALRTQAGMTQMELSRELGISYQQVQKYEYGRSELSITRLVQISKVFGVSPVVFLGGHDSNCLEVTDEERQIINHLRNIEKLEIKSLLLTGLRKIDGSFNP